jgi:iron(III) transport system substrate-binding protein
MSIVKGARNLDSAKKFYDWALSPAACRRSPSAGEILPGAVEQERARLRAGAEDVGDEADRLRLRQIRLLGRAQVRLLSKWDKEVKSLPK